MKHSNKTYKYSLLLGGITFACTAILTLVYFATKGAIEKSLKAQQNDLFAQVVPSKFYDNDIAGTCKLVIDTAHPFIDKIYTARKQGKITAYVIEGTTSEGYSGDISVLVGISLQNEILGVRILSHNETPGLGDKIDLRVSNWILSFTGKIFRLNEIKKWFVKKDGGEFDQFTGATITPRAVVGQVRNSALWILEAKKQNNLIQEFKDCN